MVARRGFITIISIWLKEYLLFFMKYVHLKGLSHEIFMPVFWPVWVHLFLQFLAAILSFGAFYTKSCWRFIESPRRIDNWICGSPRNRDTLMLLRTFSGNSGINHQSFLEFYKSPRSIDSLCSISRRTANPDRRKIVEPWTQLSSLCQVFLEILVWHETYQNLSWLSKIEGMSLKLKNQKQFLFRPR